MRFIAPEECQKWLEQNGFAFEFQAEGDQHWSTVEFSLPTNTTRLIVLSHEFQNLTGIHEGLLWITQSGIWPENINLFDGYRTYLGEHRALHEAPGLVFATGDSMIFVSILNLSLFFLWDGVVINKTSKTVVQFNHDEYIRVSCADGKRLEEIKGRFKNFGLNELSGAG